MNNKVKTAGTIFIGVTLGAVVTVAAVLFFPINSSTDDGAESNDNKPLHWVAPMDPNYIRDKPGKSPMGMDLLPVYKDEDDSSNNSPGTIRISPDVVNNLGVKTARVTFDTLHTEIKTVGYVQYDEDNLVHIHPRVKGWIEKLFVKSEGDPVKKGQALYQIYSPELVNAQEELVLALRRKNKFLIKASEDRLKALQLPVSVIKKLKSTLKVRQNITFYAPQDGVIDKLNIREGFYVQPNTTLLSIAALDPIWVEAEVFERQASLVTKGLPVSMSLAYLPKENWQGEVDYIYPTLDQKTRTLRVRLRFSNESGALKPNMFAQVAIHVLSNKKTLLVPKVAVIRTGSFDRVVIALGEGRFKSVEVKVGQYDDQSAEILQGLSEGDMVVTSAQFLLDSESSKTSDFNRMNHLQDPENEGSNSPLKNKINSAEVDGVINSIMADHKMLNISRGAIPKWNRPAATVDFMVDDQVDLTSLTNDMKINFIFHVDNGKFIITKIMSNSTESATSHESH